jgi:hypothetical protein
VGVVKSRWVWWGLPPVRLQAGRAIAGHARVHWPQPPLGRLSNAVRPAAAARAAARASLGDRGPQCLIWGPRAAFARGSVGRQVWGGGAPQGRGLPSRHPPAFPSGVPVGAPGPADLFER